MRQKCNLFFNTGIKNFLIFAVENYLPMKNMSYFFGVIMVFVGSLLYMSCKKDTTCKVNVKCVNASTGAAVDGALVKLYAPVKTASGGTVVADVKAEGTTNSDGVVSFKFKLPAIFNIRAEKTSDSLVGTGMVTLEEGKTVDATVQMKHQ
ncbi:MAG: hypothetical protein KatS3mg027_0786 [Bacteroidia bacterium]|nr:MAG: hypothetical protein KatS3mg027_0786 [Bacteroidia bacterium]